MRIMMQNRDLQQARDKITKNKKKVLAAISRTFTKGKEDVNKFAQNNCC